jgi:hypothetical protein
MNLGTYFRNAISHGSELRTQCFGIRDGRLAHLVTANVGGREIIEGYLALGERQVPRG